MNVERTVELLRAANPVPDESVTEELHETSTAYLASLEQRSEEMLRVESDFDRSTGWDPRRVIVVAVAAAVLVAAIGYGLVSLLGPADDVIDGGVDLSDPLSVLPGSWESSYGTFEFRADSTYRVTDDLGMEETGTYRVIGNLLTLVADADSPVCAGAVDTLNITIESADLITFELEAVGCEAHFVLLCVSPIGTPAEPGCGRFDRVSD